MRRVSLSLAGWQVGQLGFNTVKESIVKTKRMTLSGTLLERVIKAGLKEVTGNDVTTVYSTGTVTVAVVDDESAPCVVEDMTDKVVIIEPDFSIGDTIIVSPVTEEGTYLVERYGNAWKIISGSSRKGVLNAEKWLLNSVLSNVAGEFAGTYTGKVVRQESMIANPANPARRFYVVLCCKYPEGFKWKKYKKILDEKGIALDALNTVNYAKGVQDTGIEMDLEDDDMEDEDQTPSEKF